MYSSIKNLPNPATDRRFGIGNVLPKVPETFERSCAPGTPGGQVPKSRAHITFAAALLLCVLPVALSHAQPGLVDKEVNRSVLIKEFHANPRALALAQTRAFAMRHDMSGDRLNQFMADFAKNYDKQVSIRDTGKLPLSVNDRMFRDLTKWAIQTTIGQYVPKSEGATRILLDAAETHLENYVASDAVAFAGSYLADRRRDSIVNLEKLTDIILDTPGIRDGLIGDVGVDISKSAQEQFALHPDVANIFLARELVTGQQSNGRRLVDIATSIQNLAESDASGRAALRDELVAYLQEGFGMVNGQISADLAMLSDAQQAREAALADRIAAHVRELSDNQNVLLAYVEDQIARQAARVEAERRQAEEEARRAEVRSYFQAGAFLLNVLEPGAGDKFAIVANSSMQIADAIKAFQATESISFGSIVDLASGISNPAMAVFSLISATGPSPEQAILDQLAQLSQQIFELREEMHERFDIVDAKLDRVLLETANGFNLASQKLDVNLQAITASLQVGLDTQSLLLSETAKLGAEIRDSVLVPCIDRASTLPLPDESFIVCASHLFNNATTRVDREQISAGGLTPESLANALQNPDGRGYELMRRELAQRSGVSLPSPAVSNASWMTAANWYHDFLVRDVAQTRRAAIDTRFPSIAERGEHIEAVRTAIYDALRNYPQSLPLSTFPEPGSEYNAAVSLVASGAAMAAELQELIAAEIDGYQLRLSNLELPFGALNSDSIRMPEYRPDSLTLNSAVRGNPVAELLSQLPPYVRAAVNHDLGSFSMSVTFTSKHIESETCGFLNTQREHHYYWDNYRLSIYFDPQPLSGLAATEVVRLSFRSTGPRIDSGCGGFLPAPPQFCATPDCLTQAVQAALSSANLTPPPEDVLRQAWETHRTAVARSVLTKLQDVHFESEVRLENAYFGALVRYAFPEALAMDDGLFALAQGRVGLPSVAEYVAHIKQVQQQQASEAAGLELVWKAPDFVGAEVQALHSFFADGVLDRAVIIQSTDLGVRMANAKLDNAGDLIRLYGDSGGTDRGTAVVSTPVVDCGSVRVGQSARCSTFTVTANGGNVQFASPPVINSNSSDFDVQSGDCTADKVLEAGDSCTFGAVTFRPGTTGSHTATLQLVFVNGNGPAITLTGTGADADDDNDGGGGGGAFDVYLLLLFGLGAALRGLGPGVAFLDLRAYGSPSMTRAAGVDLRGPLTNWRLVAVRDDGVIVLGDMNDVPEAATSQMLVGPTGSEKGTLGFDRRDPGDT